MNADAKKVSKRTRATNTVSMWTSAKLIHLPVALINIVTILSAHTSANACLDSLRQSLEIVRTSMSVKRSQVDVGPTLDAKIFQVTMNAHVSSTTTITMTAANASMTCHAKAL